MRSMLVCRQAELHRLPCAGRLVRLASVSRPEERLAWRTVLDDRRAVRQQRN